MKTVNVFGYETIYQSRVFEIEVPDDVEEDNISEYACAKAREIVNNDTVEDYERLWHCDETDMEFELMNE